MGDVPVRVCILSSVHNLYDTRIFYKEAKSLLKEGYHVSYIVQNEKKEWIDGIKIVPLKKPKSRFRRAVFTSFEVYRKAIKEKADIYHFHDPELLFVGLLLKLRKKVVIYDIHENVAEQIKTKKWIPFNKLVSRVYRCIELVLCRFFPLILAEESYNKSYPNMKKINVLNFPDLKMFPSPPKNKENYIVYLGGVTKDRGIETTLEAMHILLKRGVQINLECIGPFFFEHYQNAVLEKCKSLNLENYVKFHGRLTAPEAYKIVGKAKAGLAILNPIANYKESFPTKIFEYMALGVPVITSNFPLYCRVIKDTKSGINVDPTDPNEVANAIQSIVEDPVKVRKMGDNGQKAVKEKYNWDKESEKLINLYRNLSKNMKK